MTENKITFDSVLNKLTQEAEKVTDILNITSERIRTIEKSLQNLNILKHEMPVKDPNASDWIISWELDEKMKPSKFRIFYSNPKEKYRKPAVESKSEIRLLLAKHMILFMNSMANQIKTKHEEIIKKEK